MRVSNFASYSNSDSAYKMDVYFGPVTWLLLMKGFDEKGVMNFVWSEVLKYHVFTVRLSSSDSIPNRYWITKVTVKYAVFFRIREGASLPVMFRYDCLYYGESQLFLGFTWKQNMRTYTRHSTSVDFPLEFIIRILYHFDRGFWYLLRDARFEFRTGCQQHWGLSRFATLQKNSSSMH